MKIIDLRSDTVTRPTSGMIAAMSAAPVGEGDDGGSWWTRYRTAVAGRLTPTALSVLEVDARWLYQWSDEWVPGRGSEVKRYGTPVLVMGDYDYAAPAPWLGLPANPRADQLDPSAVDSALAPHAATILARSAAPTPGTPLALR